MNSYDTVGWSFIEEAVIRDRGYDEEGVLTSMLQSYFIRRGFVDTLSALNDELNELEANGAAGSCAKRGRSSSSSSANADSTCVRGTVKNGNGNDFPGAVMENVRKRKHVQLLCLDERYEEAAAVLPNGSVFRVKLLAMEAIKRAKSDVASALLFLCEKVGPLVATLSDATLAHHIYIGTLATITGASASAWEMPSSYTIARELNDSLLENKEPSAIDVLLSWSEWQAMTKLTETEAQVKGSSPYMMDTERL